MRVTALFFALYRDLAGAAELDVDLEPGADAADLVRSLRERGGQWLRLPPAPAIAVNEEYLPLSVRLNEGDVVALIPPLSGG